MEATDCPYYLPSRPHKELQARLPIQTSPLFTSLPTLIFFLNIPRGLNTIFGYVISLPKTAQWLPQMFTSQASKWHSTYIPSPAQNPLSSKSIGLIPLHTIYYLFLRMALNLWSSRFSSRVPENISLCSQAQLAYLFVYLFITIICSSSASSHLPRLSFSMLTCKACSNFSMKDWCHPNLCHTFFYQSI